jgi:hypothetical protein
VATAQTITSGQDINLGILGGKIRFTLGASELFVMGDKWTVSCNIYNLTIKKVIQASALPAILDPLPGIAFGVGPQEYRSPDGERYRPILKCRVELWVHDTDPTNLSAQLVLGLQDIEHAIVRDVTLTGAVEDIQFVSCDPGLPLPDRPFGVMQIEMDIHFLQVIN